jgi:hypothetical protein
MLKAGDAFIYDHDGWVIEGFITGECEYRNWVLTDWCYVKAQYSPVQGRWNDNERGTLPIEYCKPHPDPDDLLVRFTAWRLLNG